ncbi:hypothetical protein B0H19DRAFT_1067341 [Mycena capillaripes]|nr:hypothetical protein B0H19DRAFT_1067341 [Mycena capillaripes]
MIKYGTEQMNNFHKFRHNQKKVDKLHGLFAANMDYIMQGAQQLVAAATPAFPPAAIIGTAFTYMLTACKQVSADYDAITEFFEDINSFLQGITILETRLDSRLPRYPAYRNCLMDVFTSLLEMCGYATKYIELGRFKKWALALVRVQDDDLGGARKKMDKSLSGLQSATEFAILGNPEETRRMALELQAHQEKQTRMLATQTQMLGTVIESQDIVRSDIKKLMTMFLQTRGDEPSKQKGKAGSQGKPPTSNRVRSIFDVTIDPVHEYHNIKDCFIPDTCTWILDEPAWDSWTQEEGNQRFLAIFGPPGAGKSQPAAFAYDHLVAAAEREPERNTCAVHFYFRETTTELNDFSCAVRTEHVPVRNNVAAKIEASGMEYYELRICFDDAVLENMAACARAILDLGSGENNLSREMVQWATEVEGDKNKALIQLARGHVENWFRASDRKAAEMAYKYARGIVTKTHLSEVVPEEPDGGFDNGKEGERTEKEILGIAEAFANIPRDGHPRWAIGALLLASRHGAAALSQGQLGVSECTDLVWRAEALDLVAQSLWSLGRYDEAYGLIDECLLIHNVPLKMHRDTLITRARIEVSLGKLDEAAESYKQARLADLDTPADGSMLREEFGVYSTKGSDAELMNVLKQWKPLERVAWMTWGCDDDSKDHDRFQKAAERCGEVGFLIQVYEEVIAFLDALDSGAPIRIQLASVHYFIRRDIDAARAILDEVLDSVTTGKLYAFTNEEPSVVLMQAVNFSADLIYEQFRSTGDRERKAQLLIEAHDLRQRPLAHSIRSPETVLTHQSITLARMTRKMGPVSEFHDLLDKIFHICYEALVDNVGWNDALNLNMMAETLWNLDPNGFEKEARILVSAMFSQLDAASGDASSTADEGGASADGEGGKDDEAEPTDDGELNNLPYSCDGCDREFTRWSEPLYQCVICAFTFLCEDCWQKRQESNGVKLTGRSYCGSNHRYVKGPIEGWKGITKGVMTIEGEEPVKFKDWLDELKEKKWKEGWERFWKAEY